MAHKLYVIVNTDLSQMTPGRAMAHSAHAANDFVEHMQLSERKKKLLEEWQGTGTFGIQINITDPISFDNFLKETYFHCYDHSGVVSDPTYPISGIPNELASHLTGDVSNITTHEKTLSAFVNVTTAVWIFVPDDDLEAVNIMKSYPLA